MRVSINAGGREVAIECGDANVSVKDVAAEALGVWVATAGAAQPSDGPAFGLGSSERRDRTMAPLNGYAREVKA